LWHDSGLYGNYTNVLRFHPADIGKDQLKIAETLQKGKNCIFCTHYNLCIYQKDYMAIANGNHFNHHTRTFRLLVVGGDRFVRITLAPSPYF